MQKHSCLMIMVLFKLFWLLAKSKSLPVPLDEQNFESKFLKNKKQILNVFGMDVFDQIMNQKDMDIIDGFSLINLSDRFSKSSSNFDTGVRTQALRDLFVTSHKEDPFQREVILGKNTFGGIVSTTQVPLTPAIFPVVTPPSFIKDKPMIPLGVSKILMDFEELSMRPQTPQLINIAGQFLNLHDFVAKVDETSGQVILIPKSDIVKKSKALSSVSTITSVTPVSENKNKLSNSTSSVVQRQVSSRDSNRRLEKATEHGNLGNINFIHNKTSSSDAKNTNTNFTVFTPDSEYIRNIMVKYLHFNLFQNFRLPSHTKEIISVLLKQEDVSSNHKLHLYSKFESQLNPKKDLSKSSQTNNPKSLKDSVKISNESNPPKQNIIELKLKALRKLSNGQKMNIIRKIIKEQRKNLHFRQQINQILKNDDGSSLSEEQVQNLIELYHRYVQENNILNSQRKLMINILLENQNAKSESPKKVNTEQNLDPNHTKIPKLLSQNDGASPRVPTLVPNLETHSRIISPSSPSEVNPNGSGSSLRKLLGAGVQKTSGRLRNIFDTVKSVSSNVKNTLGVTIQTTATGLKDAFGSVSTASSKIKDSLAVASQAAVSRAKAAISPTVEVASTGIKRLQDRIGRGARLAGLELSHLAKETTDRLLSGIEQGAESVSDIAKDAYRGARQTQFYLERLASESIKHWGEFLGSTLKQIFKKTENIVNSFGNFLVDLQSNIFDGLSNGGEAIKSLVSSKAKSVNKAVQSTAGVLKRVALGSIETITGYRPGD